MTTTYENWKDANTLTQKITDGYEDYDWDKLKLKSKSIGEFIDIKEIEPDEFKRKVEYSNVIQIKLDVYDYVKPDGSSIKRTITTRRCKGGQATIKRRLNWKPFGAALDGNKGLTTIGQDVYMEMCGKDYGMGSKIKISMKEPSNYSRIFGKRKKRF